MLLIVTVRFCERQKVTPGPSHRAFVPKVGVNPYIRADIRINTELALSPNASIPNHKAEY